MKIVTADITGSLIVNNVDVTNNVVSSSAFSSSIAGRVTNLEQFSSSLDATFATDASVSASILVLSQSVQASQAALSSSYTATSGSYLAVSASYVTTSGSYAAASASLSTRVTNVEATASTNTQASASFAAYSASVSTRLTTDETNITTLTNASASFAAQSASLSTRLTTDETNITTLTNASASFAIVSSSYASASGSLSTRVTNLESTSSTVSSSFASTSGSIAGRVTCIEGQYATTGSNTFTKRQYISDVSNAIGFASTASLYTDGGLRVTKDSFISGTAYFNNVVVYGTSSIQYITSSQVNIGANIINLNTNTPAVRFGGMAVADSGSNAGITGSMLWDSEQNRWVYSNPSGSTYDGGMIISGPRNTSGLGNEQGTTACAVMIGQGGDHITSSAIFSYGNATCFYGTSFISSSGAICTTMSNTSCIGVGTTAPTALLHISTSATACDTLRISNGAQSLNLGVNNGSGGSYIFENCVQDFRIGTSGTERARITSAGIACFACQVCLSNQLVVQDGANSIFAWSSCGNLQPGLYAVSCIGSSVSSLYAKVYGSQVNAGVFGVNTQCVAIVVTEGACNKGLMVGTMNSAPLYIGTNNAVRATVASSGETTFNCQVCAPYICVGQNTTGDTSNYSLSINRHGSLSCSHAYTTVPAFIINELSNSGPTSGIVDTQGIWNLSFGRYSHTMACAKFASLMFVGYDGPTGPLRVDGRGNMFIGYDRSAANPSDATFSLLVACGIAVGSYQYCVPPNGGALFSGCVGIGITSPNSPLHIVTSTGVSTTSAIRVRQTNSTDRTSRIQLEDYNGTIADGLIDFVIPTAGSSTGARLSLGVSATSLHIVNGGNVGIGTCSPSNTVHILGTSDQQLKIDVAAGATYSSINFARANTNVGAIAYGHSINEFQVPYTACSCSYIAMYTGAGQKSVVIDKTGYVTKPYQIAFKARNSTTINVSADAKLTLDTTDYNVGNGYSTSTGIFTAPAAGKYLFNFVASAIANGSFQYNAVYLIVSGAATGIRFRGPGYLTAGAWFGIAGSIILDLAASATVQINGYTQASSMDLQINETNWTGYLLG